EFAARGGNKSKGYIFSGSDNLSEAGWYWDNIPSQNSSNSGYGAQPVGQKKANELGIYDMSGNVWEWCSDWYGSYSTGLITDPVGPSSGSDRVIRGGGWYNYSQICRVAIRSYATPSSGNGDLGFRVAFDSSSLALQE
ncbi:MAG: formylglycine-generating enzyme family protein, partial [Chitinispirillales bacterium]|nr:formylglycine-generating enzyme family protein [Chitinispirillales bacterium]